MSDICIDTGFLLGLYVESDAYHEPAQRCFSDYFELTANRLIVPWPILYETISTRLSRNRPAMILLELDWKRLLRQQRLELLSDSPFRDGAIDECFDELARPRLHARNLSLVDRVIRRMLADTNLRLEAFVTFNPGDFVDVCRKYNRTILP
jgi:predicted nucleic acid-binding protein